MEPEEQPQFGNATMDRLVQFAYDQREPRNDGTDTFAHAERIIDILQTNGGIDLSPGLKLGVYLHDVLYERRNRAEKSIELGLHHHINSQFSEVMPGIKAINDPDGLLTANYAMGIVMAAHQYEVAGEAWRGDLQTWAQGKANRFTYEFLEAKVAGVLKQTNSTKPLQQLREEIALGIKSGKAPVSSEMMAFRAPMANFDLMVGTLSNWDIEGLLIKSAEVMDNVRHPNEERPASAWRDAQELLSFYAPLLELAGFKELAMEAYSRSYSYLNRDQANFEVAAELYRSSEAYIEQYGAEIVEDLRAIGGENSQVRFRIKTTGSILEKFQGRDKFNGSNPDNVGFTLVVDDPPAGISMDDYIHAKIDAILATLTQERNYGLVPGHTRGDPAVEVNFSGITPAILTDEVGTVTQTWNGPRKSGYEAAHLSFITASGAGFEIQLRTASAEALYTKGTVHHVFYKAREGGMGRLGILQRALNQTNPGAEPNKYKRIFETYKRYEREVLTKLDFILQRSDAFRSRLADDQPFLTPAAMRVLLSLPNLNTLPANLVQTLSPRLSFN